MPGSGDPEQGDAEAWSRARLGMQAHRCLMVRMGIWLDGVEVNNGA